MSGNDDNENGNRPGVDEAQAQPVMQPDDPKGEAPTGEKGAQDIAQGADPDAP